MPDDELERRHFEPGEVIFAQGDSGDEAFILESGTVEISRGDSRAELIIAMVRQGELIGEMALLDSAPRMATARARGNATCVVIPKRVFDRLLRESNPVLVAILNTLMKRLRSDSDKTVKSTL